jgi:hypothetical protein
VACLVNFEVLAHHLNFNHHFLLSNNLIALNMNTDSTSADESGIDKSSIQSEDTKAQTSESTPVNGATKGVS